MEMKHSEIAALPQTERQAIWAARRLAKDAEYERKVARRTALGQRMSIMKVVGGVVLLVVAIVAANGASSTPATGPTGSTSWHNANDDACSKSWNDAGTRAATICLDQDYRITEEYTESP